MAIKSVNSSTAKTSFNEAITVEKTTIFDLKPQYGGSMIRDNITASINGGTIAELDGELTLLTTTNTVSIAQVDSVQRGVYIAGKSAECGIGFRYPANPTGTIVAEWGLLNDANGYYFGIDSTSRFVAVRRNSVNTVIRQSSWNLDRMDGTGISGVNLTNFTNIGLIYQIRFTWYGYGGVVFQILIPGVLEDRLIEVHRYRPTAGINSTIDPNLPIRVKVSNNGTATSFNAFVGGRQYSVFGKFNPQNRTTTAYRLNTSTTSGLWFPVIIWRLKTLFNGRSNSISSAPGGFTAQSSSRPHIVGLFLEDINIVTTGAFVQPPLVPTNESGLEVNITATDYTPSANAYLMYTSAFERSGAATDTSFQDLQTQFSNIPINKHLIFALQPLGGANGVVDIATFNMIERR